MFRADAAVDAVFGAFGVVVTVHDPAPRPVRAIVRAPDEVERVASRDVLTTSVMIEIRAADLGAVGPGTSVVVDGAPREVRGAPQYRDDLRLVVVLNTAPAAEVPGP